MPLVTATSPGPGRVPPRVEAQGRAVERPARRLVAQVDGGDRAGDGHLLVGDHVDRSRLGADRGDVSAQLLVGARQADDGVGGAERRVGLELGGVGRRAQPDDRGGDRHGQHGEDQHVAAPLPAEQPPSPADDGAAGRGSTVALGPATRPGGRPRGRSWVGGEQGLGPRGRRRLVDDPAVAEEHDPVRPGRQLGVVGDDHPGHSPLARGSDEPHHRLPVGRVERAGRLVGEQQPAVADDRPGDGDPLALTAGQLVREAPRPFPEAELLERPKAGLPGRSSPAPRRARGAATRSPPR